ncbi:MAG: DUF523 domain-containing protein [Candidatus Nealsonbacteria bacterium]
MKLCSACLLGVKCRYDGQSLLNEKIFELSKKDKLLPVCPEVLGGLPVPREEAQIKNGRVITKSGEDITSFFEKGASEVLKIAKSFDIKEAILKQRSPSCGCGQIYDGTFSGKTIKGDGVTTALLKKNGIKVISEEESVVIDVGRQLLDGGCRDIRFPK